MSVNRELWKEMFTEENIPLLPCPHCKNGVIAAGNSQIVRSEAGYSKALYKTEEWEPDWKVERFSIHLHCTKSDCGEVVIMSGDFDIVETDATDSSNAPGHYQQQVMKPTNVHPGPPLFPIPKEVPQEVVKQLKLAFELYWQDKAACISRIRTSVERMLDQQGIPKDIVKKGEVIPLKLADRIKKFQDAVQDQDSTDSLTALRHIGNLGVHEAEISQEALFDALDVYESVLLDIYTNKSLRAKKAKLISTKGKY